MAMLREERNVVSVLRFMPGRGCSVSCERRASPVADEDEAKAGGRCRKQVVFCYAPRRFVYGVCHAARVCYGAAAWCARHDIGISRYSVELPSDADSAARFERQHYASCPTKAIIFAPRGLPRTFRLLDLNPAHRARHPPQ